jgi:hypothetical protein
MRPRARYWNSLDPTVRSRLRLMAQMPLAANVLLRLIQYAIHTCRCWKRVALPVWK